MPGQRLPSAALFQAAGRKVPHRTQWINAVFPTLPSSFPMGSASPPIGVLLAQLGTPAAPSATALRPYLKQFLSDPRVIDLPRWKWLPVLYLLVLPRRPARSAALYKNVWTDRGSPLLLHSRAQEKGLQQRLGERYRVVLGMRYGEPSIERALRQMEAQEIDRIVVLPMFPQFSASTTGSVYDAVTRSGFGRSGAFLFDRRRTMPALRFVPPYFDDCGYIDSLKAVVEDSLASMQEPPERFLITFHGIPKRYVDEGDPYRRQCEATAGLFAEALGLSRKRWHLGFQSRFGREEWLQPYTEDVLAQLGRQGGGRLGVVAPGFTADCLETLDELGREGEEIFRAAGGGHLHLVPCLNSHPRWLDAMASLVRRESSGWI